MTVSVCGCFMWSLHSLIDIISTTSHSQTNIDFHHQISYLSAKTILALISFQTHLLGNGVDFNRHVYMPHWGYCFSKNAMHICLRILAFGQKKSHSRPLCAAFPVCASAPLSFSSAVTKINPEVYS